MTGTDDIMSSSNERTEKENKCGEWLEGASWRENWAGEDQGPRTAGTKGRSRELRPAPEEGRLPGELEGKPEGQTGWSRPGEAKAVFE